MKPDQAKGFSTIDTAEEPALTALHESVRRLRFGSIAVTVHDGRIVQLDITEKRRFGH